MGSSERRVPLESVTDRVTRLIGTAIVRGDRFTDGTIGAALEEGSFQAALRRLRRWSDDERMPAEG